MKKTLTLFLIGAMALGSAFTLTSCSGGGDKEKTADDVVSLNDFRKGKKQFHLMGLVPLIVTPEMEISGAHGSNIDTAYVTGYVEFAGVTFDCEFMYRTDELNQPSGEPVQSHLNITFLSLDAITSPAVLASLGMDPQGGGLVGEQVQLQFNFTTHEVQVLSSTQGTVTINYPDPMGEYVTFDAWVRSVANTNFYVNKKG